METLLLGCFVGVAILALDILLGFLAKRRRPFSRAATMRSSTRTPPASSLRLVRVFAKTNPICGMMLV
jgi:hypothetical protein